MYVVSGRLFGCVSFAVASVVFCVCSGGMSLLFVGMSLRGCLRRRYGGCGPGCASDPSASGKRKNLCKY